MHSTDTEFAGPDSVTIRIGNTSLRWDEIWASGRLSQGWSHSGITTIGDGTVVFAHPEGHRLVAVPADDRAEPLEVQTPLTEMHCLVHDGIDEREVVWAADNGRRRVQARPDYVNEYAKGRVAALDMTGNILREIDCPPLEAYAEEGWRPTSIAIDEQTRDIWVADGYGQNLVHRFDSAGTLRLTIDGTESGQRFSCPHGVLLRRRGEDHELYVADRSNRRIVVYSTEGEFRREFGSAELSSPSSFAELDGMLLVTELHGSIAWFDGDEFTGRIGQSRRSPSEDAWPNRRDRSGSAIPPDTEPGRFNSPHGIAVVDSDVLVTEWMIGGRVVRLRQASDSE